MVMVVMLVIGVACDPSRQKPVRTTLPGVEAVATAACEPYRGLKSYGQSSTAYMRSNSTWYVAVHAYCNDDTYVRGALEVE